MKCLTEEEIIALASTPEHCPINVFGDDEAVNRMTGEQARRCAIAFARGIEEKLVANAVGTPVKSVRYECRWKDMDPNTVTYGCWYPWRVCAKSQAEDIREYIRQGRAYQLRTVFVSEPEGYETGIE